MNRGVRMTILILAAAPAFAEAAPAASTAAASIAASTAAASAPAVSTSAVATPEACAAAAPKPMLKKSAYRGYSFTPGSENTAVEKAEAGELGIEIQYAGCYDGVEHGFVFDVRKPLASYRDLPYWLTFAAERLKALETVGKQGPADVKDLAAFLAAAKTSTARMNESEVRLEACRDGSPPTEDGCSLESGGGYRFAVRKDGADIQVFASRYVAL